MNKYYEKQHQIYMRLYENGLLKNKKVGGEKWNSAPSADTHA